MSGSIKIVDLMGKTIIHKPKQNIEKETILDISSLSPGLYIAQLEFGNSIHVEKIIVNWINWFRPGREIVMIILGIRRVIVVNVSLNDLT